MPSKNKEMIDTTPATPADINPRQYVAHIIGILDRPLEGLSAEEAAGKYEEKLVAASILARISLLDENARQLIREESTDDVTAKRRLKSTLGEAKFYDENGFDEEDASLKDDVVEELAKEFISVWGERTGRKYSGPIGIEIDSKTGKLTNQNKDKDSDSVEKTTEKASIPNVPAIEFPVVMDANEVTRRLRRLGWVRRNGNGGHVRFQNEDGRIVRFGINHGEIPRGSLRADLRHAGISAEEFMSD